MISPEAWRDLFPNEQDVFQLSLEATLLTRLRIFDFELERVVC